MAESKFLPFQDADGDLHNDECKIDEVVLEGKVCPTCIPNDSALVPDWKTQKEPFLNEKICKYQITYRTQESSTGFKPGMTEGDAGKALAEIFNKYKEPAAIELLEAYDRETTPGAIQLVVEHLECTDYDLQARPKSKLKLLYSIAHDILEAIEQAEEDDENEDDPCQVEDIVVTYMTSDLQDKLLRVRKGLKLYNRYYKIFGFSNGLQRFVFSQGKTKGKEFDLKYYGDFGLGLNGEENKKARLELVYTNLDKFLTDRGFALRKLRGFPFISEPVTKIEMYFDSEYNINKLKVYTERCGIKPTVFTKKLKLLKKLNGWKDKTAVAYFCQLDKMDQDLQAREPKPWKDFIIDYTYPRVELIGASQAVGAVQSAAGCVQQAIENKVFDGSFFDREFSFSDALAVKWRERYCNTSEEELRTIRQSLGIDLFAGRENLEDFLNAAKGQAFGTITVQNDPLDLICLSLAGDLDCLQIGESGALGELKLCGLEAALTQAITCLMGGLSLEQALAAVARSALQAMNIQSFKDLFFGLPAEQQAELDALAQKKLKEGDIFKADSTAQKVSDAIAGNNITTLKQLDAQTQVSGSGTTEEGTEESRQKRVYGWLEEGGGFITDEVDPNATKRTLAQKFENPAGDIKQNQLIQAYIAALLEYYADNLLELVDQLNRFPGARLISTALLNVQCPRPPIFNPTVFDFIKDLELPFCRNINDITLPKLVNPNAWLSVKADIFKALFEALQNVILQLVMCILVKLFVKICDIVGSAVCGALGVVGSTAAGLVTGGAAGVETLSSIFRNAVCGEDASDEDINNAIVDMLANFGVGAQAFANQDATLSLAESMANSLTQKEMADAFLGNMSSEAATILSEVVNSEHPEFSDALSNPESISEMFSSMGQLMPSSFKDTLRDVSNQINDQDQTPVNPSLCASELALAEFCGARSDILAGRASSEQISKLCDNQFNPDDLSDLQSALQGDYIANNLPPIASDPGCDNGLLPYEPQETIAAVTNGLGNDMELLQIAYSKDMLGNGPTDDNWGMINMMMSDTDGLPLTTHIRKSSINPFYVDQYGTFFPDAATVTAVGLANPAAAIVLDRLDQSNRNGAYPEKMAAYLQLYMNDQIDQNTRLINYNNSSSDEYSKTMAITSRKEKNSAGDIFMSDTSYNVDSAYTYDSDGDIDGLKITYKVKKDQKDIMLSYNDYANGYRRFEESEYEYGFDISAYTSEINEVEGAKVNIYSDNMRIMIDERQNLAAKSYNKKTAIDIQVDGDEVITSEESEKNSDTDIETGTRFNFLSVDDTFDDIIEELEKYQSFQNCFTQQSSYQPQTHLLKGILERSGVTGLSLNQLRDYRNTTSNSMMENIFKAVADTESEVNAWLYGAVAETLTVEDTQYGINDNGTWIPYKDTDFEEEDMILGISYDQYKNEISGTLEKTRVFYLEPEDFGGSYKQPGIYVKPPEFKGWYGLVDILFPDYSPCKPQSTNLVNFDNIKDKISEIYPSIPEDERLKSDPDCIVELPYNRVLERPAKSAMIGLIIAACRIYASAHIIKTLPTFAKFSPKFPDVFSSSYASYIIENMQESFKNTKDRDFFGFSDNDFWYGFLEQCVQMYSYRVDIGDIDPPEAVLQALMRLNDLQSEYDYPMSRKEVAGDIGTFQTLKNYRMQKNLEAVRKSEDDAKIVMKEWVIEQLNYIASKLIKSLEEIGFNPDVKDINYYVMEEYTSGASLTVNQNIDNNGNVKAVYGSLPEIPYEDNDEVEEPYYSYGGELVIKELNYGPRIPENSTLQVGQEYIGFYHVHIDEDGNIIYMAGESHSDQAHHVLDPISDIMTIPVGDVADLNTATIDTTKPFIMEKYISIDGTRYSTSEAMTIIRSQDQDKLVSEVYPGDMKLVTNENGVDVGITGELGIKYGLKFSLSIEGTAYEFTTVELGALDLALKDISTLSPDSVKLYCLLKELKEDPKFKMLVKYIIPVNKFLSLTAIYNDMAMLPSIGQLTVKKPNPFAQSLEAKLESLAGVLPEEVNTLTGQVIIDELDLDRPVGAWAHPDDRSDRKGLLVLSWDNWSQETLINSAKRIKKLFKTYYNSRDFNIEDLSDNQDSPGKIFEKSLRDVFRPASGRQLLPWFKKRNLVTDNPFNSLGELCKKEDN